MDKYLEISVAGEGAYGIVLKCKRKDSGEVVAIKQFKEDDEADEEAARVIQREIKILRMLKHENIVDMREVFREKGTLHIVFNYMDKCLLDVMDANPGGLDCETARRLICQLTRAIEHCHRHNIIHRDIKPDNLLIGSVDNSLQLCDFGSACTTSGKEELTDYVATRWYRAPELLVRFNDYGPGVDMWGLGCVMAELISGQALFAGKTDVDQLFIIINALGPLTSKQTKRCFDLTGFVKFPEVGERQTLEKKLRPKATDQQMQFLSRIFVVDATQRLVAKTALTLPWLTDWSASSPPASTNPSLSHVGDGGSQAQPRTTAGDPDFGLQPKPRISKSLGVPGAASVKEKPAVGIVANAYENIRRKCQEPELESISSFQAGASTVHQAPQLPLNDSCAEISDSSIMEECVDSSLASTPVKNAPAASESHDPSSFVAAGSSGYGIGIVAAAPAIVVPDPGLHETTSFHSQESMSSFQTGAASKHQNLSMQRKPRENSAQESMLSIHESMSLKHQDQFDESITEELSDEPSSPEKVSIKPVVRPTLPPRQGNLRTPQASRPSSERHRLIRPVSGSYRPASGSSVRSSSLTPMS